MFDQSENFNEKRSSQRVHFARPIKGRLESENALILDLGLAGASVEHHDKLAVGGIVTLTFEFQESRIQYRSKVNRSTIARYIDRAQTKPVYHSGLRFAEAIGDSEVLLHRFIMIQAKLILQAQAANAMGIRDAKIADPEALISLGSARRMRDSGFIRMRLKASVWEETRTTVSDQPADGFTIAAYEDPEQLAILCRTYELSDALGRRLIRLIAEVSVSEIGVVETGNGR